jgi:hypothetical protein
MGKEATCTCRWGDETAEVKALLETGELILRGGLRRRLPFAAISGVHTTGNRLVFQVNGETVSLELGEAQAESWARSILLPPPSLAKKLGITAETTVRILGELDDPALETALEAAKGISQSKGELILARAGLAAELAAQLHQAKAQLDSGVPIWVVFPKGVKGKAAGQTISEAEVRALILPRGLVDTKVASVSQRLTAMRFVKRKS